MDKSFFIFFAMAIPLSIASGFLVRWALDALVSSYRKPERIPKDAWQLIVDSIESLLADGSSAGWVVGSLERLLFVVAIQQDELFLVAGWLAFKVATKWQAWSGVFDTFKLKQAPLDDDTYNDFNICASRYFRWRVSQRFLVGNLLNIGMAALIYVATIEITSILCQLHNAPV